MSDVDLNNEINKRKLEIEDQDARTKGKKQEEIQEAKITSYDLDLTRMQGRGDEVTKMRNDIQLWQKIMGNDVEYQEGLNSLPKITSEHYKALKRTGSKLEKSLANVNEELIGLFTPSTMNVLRPDRDMDRKWMDKICLYDTYRYQKHIMECIRTKPMKSGNLKKGGQGKGLKIINRTKKQNSELIRDEYDQSTDEFAGNTNKEIEEFRINKDTQFYFLNKMIDNYKCWADETLSEIKRIPKEDQDRIIFWAQTQILAEEDESYNEQDDESDMQRKDELAIRRKIQRVGIIRYCFEPLMNDVDLETIGTLKNYVTCAEGNDVEPICTE
jgi:hypothetical protein